MFINEVKVQSEINRLMNIRNARIGINIDSYLDSKMFSCIENRKCESSDLMKWINTAYRQICIDYGYMPIELAVGKTSTTCIYVFKKPANWFNIGERNKYFAVLVNI